MVRDNTERPRIGRQNEQDDEQETWECDECGEEFHSENALYGHLGSH